MGLFKLKSFTLKYAFNTIESFNTCLRKYTLNKKVFTYDDPAFKSRYLSAQSNRKNEGKHVLNGDTDLHQLYICFPNRL